MTEEQIKVCLVDFLRSLSSEMECETEKDLRSAFAYHDGAEDFAFYIIQHLQKDGDME